MPGEILVIACGALAREIEDLRRLNGWTHLHLSCLDAKLHHRPARIPARLREKIRRNKAKYDRIYVAYADCGTRGEIDRVLEEEGPGIERLPGVHCYQFFAGRERFAAIADEEPGTFYLTDFLAQHFDRFVIEPLKLDKHPELFEAFFGNYRRVVYLSQLEDPELLAAAQAAARRLGLEFEHVHCGYGELAVNLRSVISRQADGQKDNHLLA